METTAVTTQQDPVLQQHIEMVGEKNWRAKLPLRRLMELNGNTVGLRPYLPLPVKRFVIVRANEGYEVAMVIGHWWRRYNLRLPLGTLIASQPPPRRSELLAMLNRLASNQVILSR